MSSYIKSYKLLNFQSWDKSSAEIPLETGMVNIIEGANETGKSVLYKVLYNFCFPGYWAPSELIRRGCDTGILLLQLEDDAAIIYALKRNSYTYVLVEADGTKTEWTNQGCPDEIINRMGLILDKETRIVLNIIDSDVSLPFIKTTPTFNASLIRSIVEPEGMTKFFQNLADTMIKVDNAHNFFGNKAATLHEQLIHIPLIDPIQMENQKADIDRLVELAEMSNSVENKVNDLFTCLREVITVVEDPSVVWNDIQLYDSLNDNFAKCDTLQKVLSEDIAVVQSPARIDSELGVLDALDNVIQKCDMLTAVLNTKPSEIRQINLDCEIDIFGKLQQLHHTLADYEKLVLADIPEVSFVDISDSLEVLQDLNSCIAGLTDLEILIQNVFNSDNRVIDIKFEIDEIVREVGVCPTCGQLLGGRNDTCIHNT